MRQTEKFTAPEKYDAHKATLNIIPKRGCIKHHWSYKPEHWTDVIMLTPDEHYKIHRLTRYDKKSMMYKTKNGILLDTKEKYLEFYEFIKISINEFPSITKHYLVTFISSIKIYEVYFHCENLQTVKYEANEYKHQNDIRGLIKIKRTDE
jgi:hypothetical protein